MATPKLIDLNGLSTFYDHIKTKISAKYSLPNGGIPKTDLASAVQTSLDKADGALQKSQGSSNSGKIIVIGSDGIAAPGNLVIAPDFSTSTAYASGDYVFYNNQLYKFTSAHAAGAWTGTDAVAVSYALEDDVADLQSAIDDIEEVTVTKTSQTVIENIFPELTWSDGYMSKNGTISGTGSNTYRHSQKYPVSPGDILAFANSNFSFSYITAFDGNTVVEASGQQGGNSFTVPQGIDGVVISEYVSRGTAAINHTYTVVTYENALADEIDTLTDKIDGIENAIVSDEYTDEETTNIYPILTWTNGKYMHPNGGEVTSENFRYSNQIPVTEGDIISYANPTYTFRFVTAYSSAESAVGSLGAESVNSYTVPSGIVFVVISDYISRGSAEIDFTDVSTKTSAYVKPIPLGYMAESGSLSSGNRLTLPYMQVKNKNRVVFNANITTLSSVKYAVGNASVAVNATNMTITNGNGTATTVPHGLTIGKNITMLIETETEEYISHVRIASDGFTFDYSTKFYAPSADAAQYVESVGSTLTECVLSWVSQNVNAPIWVFGDSYISWYDARWTYYLAQDGYDKNVMLNGFAGQGSSTAYRALDNLLKITTPKIVVWCLGMNDPDSGNAVNATWKSIYDKILNLQKKYGFELVLYTVPTTPTMDNTYKDAIIRTSGIRYIEADKAVRIDNSGHWVGNGTEYAALAGDNVHPTAYGAKILYNRILADLPEIMCNM